MPIQDCCMQAHTEEGCVQRWLRCYAALVHARRELNKIRLVAGLVHSTQRGTHRHLLVVPHSLLSTLYCPTAQVGRLQCVHPQGSMASVHPNHLSLERWLQAKDGNGAPIPDYSWGIPLLGDGSQNNPHGELNGAKTIPVSFGGSGDGERSPNLLPVEPRLALHSHPSTKVEFHPSVHPKSYPSTHSPSPSSRPPP